MKKLRVFLLLSALIFVLLFAVPQYLIRQEIAAAQDDLARLAVKPAPAQTAGGDALWLVGYRAETAAERERMMATHRPLLMRGKQPPALAEYELPQPENGEFTCGSGKSAADCLAEIRGNLPQYRDQAEKYRELLANIDRLADYDAFAQSGWPNDHTGSSDMALPRLQHLFLSVPTAALDWADGRQQAALVHVCRSLKTGRTLLQGRPNMLYPMVGNALIQKHTALAAQMLAEDPSWAKRLPKECDGAFAVLSPQEQNLCTAVQDEFHASANLLRKMSPEWSPRKMFTVTALAANMSDEDSIGSLRIPRWMIWVPVMDIEHSRARSAAYYAQGCNAETAAALERDQAIIWQPLAQASWKQLWACSNNGQGCVLSDIALTSWDSYFQHVQDSAMQQRAFQAALALYRLPAAERRGAIGRILAEHSSPSRRLVWNEQNSSIGFARYSKHQTESGDIPVNLR